MQNSNATARGLDELSSAIDTDVIFLPRLFPFYGYGLTGILGNSLRFDS